MNDEYKYEKVARDFITLNRTGFLSTISVSEAGYPFGSITPYDIDSEGRLIILIADISEHYKNLMADNRGSMLISDQFGTHDPQLYARATVLGKFGTVPADELEEVSWSYKSRFPDAVERERQHGFNYWRCVPAKIRWIGGFGLIGWIDGVAYSDVVPDPLAYVGWDILQHMNIDHEKSLYTLLKTYGKIDIDAKRIEMTDLCENNFTLQFSDGVNWKRVTIDFPETAEDSIGARKLFISMLEKVS